MKKTLLTMALVLTLGLGANAQTSDWLDWDETDEYTFDASNFNLDWASFSDLFDVASEVNIIEDWFSKNELINLGDRSGIGISLPGSHGGGGDIDAAPLGSGIAVLAGLGAAYAMAKRRRKE